MVRLSGRTSDPLRAFEKTLGYRFKQRKYLTEALTHRSAVAELSRDGASTPWNERLEFLGDAVLSLAISTELMDRGQHLPEGDLSRIRASLVNEAMLARLARKVQIGDYLVLGAGERKSGGAAKDSLLADALEAVIAAIYRDAGFDAAAKVVKRLFGDEMTGDVSQILMPDYKTLLQELAQEQHKVTPTYEVVTAEGPEHRKEFTIVVRIKDQVLGEGRGISKKKAAQAAAKAALDRLAGDERIQRGRRSGSTVSKGEVL